MRQPFLLGLILVLLISCDLQKSSDSHTPPAKPKYSEAYRAPFYQNQDRIQKVVDKSSKIHDLVEELAKDRKIPGVSYGVVVDDSLVIASSTGMINLEKELPASTTSCFRIASMTKSFTAMAIIQLRDEGKLSLEDPISKYIPETSDLTYLTADAPPIDIQNLLTMTAGFPEDNPWGDRQLDEQDEMLMNMMTTGVAFSNTPSFTYEYSNTGYALLGNIISRVSGIPYQEYIRQNILHPLGMYDTYWEYDKIPEDQLAIGYRWEDEEWKLEPILHDGSFGAMGGLITTITDFSKYVSFHLSAWPPRNDPEQGPVKRSSIREMHTPQFSRLLARARDYNKETCPMITGYGYGLGINQDCKGIRRVRHGGALPGFGSNYIVYPDYGIGIMAFGNLTYTGPLPSTDMEKLIFETVGIEPRKLPASDILQQRQKQITEMIQSWNPQLESEILAENFYPDQSRERRISEIKNTLEKAGDIQSVEDIEPFNQLRGVYNLIAENGKVRVYFTLSPEKDPKVQHLRVSFEPTLN
ncbi:MAG: beta-lactamase family protein [Bacteroidia bacterium]|nr:beta-lactamase family protein [Bacteroidia bacterium]